MQEQMKGNSSILERFEFRDIRQEEADQAVLIEKICFPPNEACSEKHMKERIGVTPELFLVAVDKTTGKLAGFLNGIATDEEKFRDEFFTDASLNNPKGKITGVSRTRSGTRDCKMLSAKRRRKGKKRNCSYLPG